MRISEKTVKIVLVCLIAFTLFVGIPVFTPITPASGAQLWNYTALGDSLAFGALATPFKGYTFLHRSAVGSDTGNYVLLYNLGVPGWTSSDLLNALQTSSGFRAAVSIAQVVTWDIGGNDLNHARSSYKNGTCGAPDNQACLVAAVNNFKANWDGILTELRGLRHPSRTAFRTYDIYNPYVSEDTASGDFSILKPYLDDVNNYIASKAATEGYLYAPVYAAFNGASGDEDPKDKGYIAFDGFHPNNLGHAKIAQLLRELGYSPLK